MTSYVSLLREGTDALAAAGIEDAAFDAKALLFAACGLDHVAYLLKKESVPSESQAAAYASLLRQRSARIPLQYLLKTQSFYGRDFSVGPGVLIPRPETEELTALCIERIRQKNYRTVYDLCAGSGCIGISIAMECPETQVYLVEKDPEALRYLRQNVPAGAGDRIHVAEADVLEGCPPGMPAPDMIVSNPPYIPAAEIGMLQPEVLHEPMLALNGGADGLLFYRAIMRHWLPRLPKNGCAAFECGEDQIPALEALFRANGSVSGKKDLFDCHRFVFVDI